jgi:hypothetical protein
MTSGLPDAPTFVTHFGDLGYAKGYVLMWDCWMSMMAQMGGVGQYMVSVGNHESVISLRRLINTHSWTPFSNRNTAPPPALAGTTTAIPA